MNQTINMKKQLLKKALSKTSNNKRQSISKQAKQIRPQNRPQSQLKKIITSQSVQIAPKSMIPSKQIKKPQFNQSIVGNILIELQTSRNNSILQKSQAQSYQSSNFTQKPSCRSAFSELLYTQQTDDVKQMIHKLFQNRNFIKSLQQEVNSYALTNIKNQQLQQMKNRLLKNQTFILSLEARIKQKKPNQKQQIIEKETKKKIINHFQFAQNQRDCHAVQTRIEKFLQQKLNKIRRKQF